jgi:hypothetical protein
MLILPARPKPHRQGVNRTGGSPNRLIAIVNEAAKLIDPSRQIACDGFWPHALEPGVVALAVKDRPRAVDVTGVQ